MNGSDRPLSRREWKGSLAGLGLVIVVGVLVEETPRGNVPQIVAILLAALAVSACLMLATRIFFGNRRSRSVALVVEGKNRVQTPRIENHA